MTDQNEEEIHYDPRLLYSVGFFVFDYVILWMENCDKIDNAKKEKEECNET